MSSSSITRESFCHTQQSESWMTPLVRYLSNEVLPANKKEAHQIRLQAMRFWLSDSKQLFRRSYSGPYLKGIHPYEVISILEEIHVGSCRAHARGQITSTSSSYPRVLVAPYAT